MTAEATACMRPCSAWASVLAYYFTAVIYGRKKFITWTSTPDAAGE